MGCSFSKKVYDGPQFLGPNGKPRYEPKYISLLLQDSNFTRSFLTFVTDSWRKGSGSMYTELETIRNDILRKRTLNSINFLIDSHDFLSIPYSRFQCYRGYEIYEKYMMHGSVKWIGISENALDDCSNKLFQNHQLQHELNAARRSSVEELTTSTSDNDLEQCSRRACTTDADCAEEPTGDEVIEQVLAVIGGVFDCKNVDVRNLFGAAVNEVTDYLETEVLPDFISVYPEAILGGLSTRGSTYAVQAAPFAPGTAGDSGICDFSVDPKVLGLLRQKPLASAIELTRLLLSDPELTMCFRGYLQRVDALCYLEAYNELRDISKKLQAAYHSVDLDYRMTSILYFLHKFHEKYISRSSPAISSSHCREVLLTSFLNHFARSPSKIDFEAGFHAFESDLFDSIASNLVDGFLLSGECRRFCTGRTTCTSGATALERSGSRSSRTVFVELAVEHSKVYADHCAELSDLKPFGGSSVKVQTLDDAATVGVETANDRKGGDTGMFSVLELLRCFCRNFQSGEEEDETDGGFYRFVKEAGRESYLQFCHGVYQYKTATFGSKMEQLAAGKKLCEKYLCLNAPACVSVPSCIRDVIYWNHVSFDSDVMDFAVVWTHNRLTQLYWLYLVLSHSAFVVSARSSGDNRALTEEGVFYTAGSVGDGPGVLFRTANMSLCDTGMRKISVPGVPRNSLAMYGTGSVDNPDGNIIIPGGISRRDRRSSVEQQAHRLKRASVQWLRKTLGSFGKVEVRDIINNVDSCSLFKEFLGKLDAAHLITFLVEVEEYRGITVPAFRIVYFKQIYYKYVHRQAILLLPISDHARSVIAAQLCSLSEDKVVDDVTRNAQYNSFSVAVTEVLSYIEGVCMPKLSKSPLFDTMAQLLLNNQKNSCNTNGCGRKTSIAVQSSELQVADLENLQTILQFQSTSRFFKDFCVRSYCAESLYFWLDVENYQNLPGGTDYMNRIALKIYHKYIVESANLQVNIPAVQRKQITESIVGCASNNAPNRYLFQKAQAEVFKMMKMDSFVMFQKSREYAAMISCVREK